MATNVEALKNLYVTLGGNAADVANLDSNSEMIEALRNVAGGGGGASPFFVVNFSTTDGQTITCDKTFAEISSATLPQIGVLHAPDGSSTLLPNCNPLYGSDEESGTIIVGYRFEKLYASVANNVLEVIRSMAVCVYSMGEVTMSFAQKEF